MLGENASLWIIPSVDEPIDSTSRVIELMREQCCYLEAETSGAVRAKFDKVTDISQWTASVNAIVASSSRVVGAVGGINGLKDASSLYWKDTYGLNIFNDEYRFRIFEMTLTPLYPVTIWFDEGVLEDTRSEIAAIAGESDPQGRFQISSDDQLMECFQAAVGGKKVQYIIRQMLKGGRDVKMPEN